MSSPINYAKVLGINSEPAAIAFAVLYAPLAAWYIRVLFFHLARFTITLTVFCFIRIASFALRAALAGSKTGGENLQLFIAEQVLQSVGFFGLLYAAYTLVMDRIDAVEQNYFKAGPQERYLPLPLRVIRNRHLFRIVMLVAVILGVVGISSTNTAVNSPLRKASTIIFMVLTALQALNTLNLLKLELGDEGVRYPSHSAFGARHGAIILLIVAVLLLVREIFVTATLGNQSTFLNEDFWYPLVVVPEFLAVVLYLMPGLIPKLN